MSFLVRYTLIILALACAAAEAQSSVEAYKPLFSTIKAEYAAGYCETVRKNGQYSDLYIRWATLIAWDDLLGYSQGAKSLTEYLVGNKNIAIAGQTLK